MAEIRRSAPATAAPSSGGVAVAKPAVSLSLPTEKSVPKDDLGDYTWLVYGEKKIGKTSLAAQFPEALFCMFEPGGKGLSVYQVPINTWAEFKKYVQLLRDTDQYSTVVLDTIDIAYEKCMSFVGNQEGFKHPSDMNDFGKSWQKVAQEFQSVIYQLVNTGRGVMFISHAKETEFEEASGRKYNKIIPTMSNQARSFVSGFVDIIAYYGYYGDERLLTIRGSDAIEAGHRLEGRFLVTNPEGGGKPERVYCIPMGESPQEGFDNIKKAFDNQQEDVNNPKDEATLTTAKAKKKK